MARQCVICEGPIVNGRCKYCGMPFKRDAELYHLNEERNDHMKHASNEAKKVMSTYPGQGNTTNPVQPKRKQEKPVGSNWHNKEVKRTGSSAATEERRKTQKKSKAGLAALIPYLVLLAMYFIFRFII